MQVQMLAREGLFGDLGSSTSRPLKPPPGPFAIITTTVQQHGLRGLWLGQTGTLIRETGGSSAWFSAYELVSRAFVSYRQSQEPAGSGRLITKKDLSTWQLMTAGACAGVSYNVVLFPADSVKSAMQTEEELRGQNGGGGSRSRPRFWKVAKEIYRTRGIKGLYAGCGVTVARSAPSSAMIFFIYETLEAKLGHHFT